MVLSGFETVVLGKWASPCAAVTVEDFVIGESELEKIRVEAGGKPEGS